LQPRVGVGLPSGSFVARCLPAMPA
jgi:hypothetical protein